MMSLVPILSGIALILFGLRFLRKGLEWTFGSQVDRALSRLAQRPARVILTGLGLGLAIPSSTSMSALLLEPLRPGRLTAPVEAIGDIVDKNRSELVLKKIRSKMAFSREGGQDLKDFFAKVRENLLIGQADFQSQDDKLAAQLLRHKEWLNNYHRALADRHLARLTAGLKESHETSAVHLDLLANLKRINSCLSHIAYATLLSRPAAGGRVVPAAGRHVGWRRDSSLPQQEGPPGHLAEPHA